MIKSVPVPGRKKEVHHYIIITSLTLHHHYIIITEGSSTNRSSTASGTDNRHAPSPDEVHMTHTETHCQRDITL